MHSCYWFQVLNWEQAKKIVGQQKDGARPTLLACIQDSAGGYIRAMLAFYTYQDYVDQDHLNRLI